MEGQLTNGITEQPSSSLSSNSHENRTVPAEPVRAKAAENNRDAPDLIESNSSNSFNKDEASIENADILNQSRISYTPETVQSKLIVIYENERYSPIAGWSAGALGSLGMSDPFAFTTPDRSAGWNTRNEASKALLSRGWSYWGDNLGQWKIDTTDLSVDSDGWSYATDFSDFTSSGGGSGEKSMRHFVRRRRRINYQFFDANSICIGSESFTCDHCDSVEVDKIAALLLRKAGEAYVKRSPQLHAECQFIETKNELFRHIGIFDSRAERQQYDYARLEQRLTKFVEQSVATSNNSTSSSSRSSSNSNSNSNGGSSSSSSNSGNNNHNSPKQGTNSFASYAISSTEINSKYDQRLPDIEAQYFTLAERQEVARLVIRKLDETHIFHCAEHHCGAQCDFATVHCAFDGCSVALSKKWLAQHENTCPQRMIACTAGCGSLVKSSEMERHTLRDCALRPITCPYYDIGCKTHLTGRELEHHMAEAQGDHLEIALYKIRDHESTISNLTSHVRQLQIALQQQQEQVNTMAGTLSSATSSLRAAEQKLDLKHEQQVRALELKVNKNSSAAAAASVQIGQLQLKVADIALQAASTAASSNDGSISSSIDANSGSSGTGLTRAASKGAPTLLSTPPSRQQDYHNNMRNQQQSGSSSGRSSGLSFTSPLAGLKNFKMPSGFSTGLGTSGTPGTGTTAATGGSGGGVRSRSSTAGSSTTYSDTNHSEENR